MSVQIVRRGALAALVVLLAALCGAATGAPTRSTAATYAVSTITLPSGAQHTLVTPAGLHVTLYASGLPYARMMALGPNGVLFVGSWYADTVSAVVPATGGKQAARVVTLLSGLTYPQSVVYYKGRLYVAEEGRVTAWTYNPASVSVSNEQVIVSSLPTGGRHVTRTISIGPDNYLYVSVGSSCNECVDYNNRGVIMRYQLDGSGGLIYAHGLRNAVGLAWQPGTGRLWSVDNGQDLLGDNIPPDEIDLISRGGNYGWPYCWGNRQQDTTLALPSANYCASTIPPVVALQAHSAPLGLTFNTSSLLPSTYKGGLFVAYHGSESRSTYTGYKVVYIPVNGTRGGTPRDFITGWLPSSIGSSGATWGRPVGVLTASDGSLLVSDDLAGVIYRVAPTGR